MGLGWHVCLQREVTSSKPPASDGKALIFRQRELNELAAELGVTPLTDFVSADPAAVAAYLREQGLNPDDFPIPDEEWHAAAEGLRTVRRLLDHIRRQPDALLDGPRIVRDLQAIEAALALAEANQVLFHLASDMPKQTSEVS